MAVSSYSDINKIQLPTKKSRLHPILHTIAHMKKTLSFFLPFMVCCACTSLEIPLSENHEPRLLTQTRTSSTLQITDYDHFLSADDAIRRIESYGQDREIKSIQLKDPKLDGSAYYEVTFLSGSKEGYAILSSDSRVNEPICLVENGSLTDTTKIIPLKYFFRAIPDYILAQKNELDSLEKGFNGFIDTRSIPALDPDQSTLIDTYYTFTRDTVLKTVPVEWGQCPPLGSSIDDDRGYCSVPATAQVMAYHKKPFSGYTVSDWNNMITGLDDDAISDIGLHIYNDLYWFNNWIAPLPSHVVSFFENNDYYASSSSGYSFTSLIQKLQYGPVIFLGFYENPITHPGTGHYWIADGAISHGMTTVYVYQHNQTGIIFEMEGNTYYNRWVRYNWGWSGSSNGWYSSGVFQPISSSHNYSNSIIMIEVEP